MKTLSFWVGLALLAFIIPVTSTAGAQTYLFNQGVFAVQGSPQSIVSGDFNGDGLTDLATADFLGSSVSILLGTSNGTFQPPADYPTDSLPYSIVTADFNRDGKLDLAVTILASNTVEVMLGNGDGTFGPGKQYQATMIQAGALTVVDLNKDGIPDLVVADSQAEQISVLLGNGDGSFQAPVYYPTAFNPTGLATGDFNGDGSVDVAVACSGAFSVTVLLGNGNGGLNALPQVALQLGPSSVVSGDLNGDDKLDLVLNGNDDSGGGIEILLGNGDGTFNVLPQAAFGLQTNQLGPIADLNHDGRPDVVAGAANGVAVWFGNGDGTFGIPKIYGGDASFGVLLSDFNHDGAIDLATVSSDSGYLNFISVLLGYGDGTFGRTTVLQPSLSNPIDIVIKDFNGDGKPDLAVLDNGFNKISVQFGNGDGTFQSAVGYSTASSPNALISADFNHDGYPDLVTTTFSYPSLSAISILPGNANGSFPSHTEFVTASGPVHVAAGDLNGDGNLDLAVTTTAGVSILLGHGDGTFSSHVDYPAGATPYDVVIGDFNNDGKLDLAITEYNGGMVAILLGNGDGTFSAAQQYATQFSPGRLAIADLNGDGNLDLEIVTQGGSGLISVMLGQGDGTFPTHVEYNTVDTPFSLIIADLNGDGIPDVATVGYTGQVSTLLGLGDGTLSASVEINDGGYASSALAVADLNADGGLDFVATNRAATASVSIVLNTPVIAIWPAKLSFPATYVGQRSKPQQVLISNPGSAPLAFHSVHFGGSDPADFSITSNCGHTLKPGKSCKASVTFVPRGIGLRSASTDLQDNGTNLTQRLTFSGEGMPVSSPRK